MNVVIEDRKNLRVLKGKDAIIGKTNNFTLITLLKTEGEEFFIEIESPTGDNETIVSECESEDTALFVFRELATEHNIKVPDDLQLKGIRVFREEYPELKIPPYE